MCININMLDQETIDKFEAFLIDLNNGKAWNESENALGVFLNVLALTLQAGEEVHLPPMEAVEELARRADENIERAKQGLPPLTSRDRMVEQMKEQLRAMGVPDEAIEAIEGAAGGGAEGIVPPGDFTPKDDRPTILPPKGDQPDKPDEGGDFRPGMYL